MTYKIIKIFLFSQLLFFYNSYGQTVFYSDSSSVSAIQSKFEVFSGEKYHYLYTFKDKKPTLKIYDHKLRNKQEVILDFLEGNLLHSHFIFKQKHIYAFWLVEQNKVFSLRLAILNEEGLMESYKSYDINDFSLADWRNTSLQIAESSDQRYLGYALSNFRKEEVVFLKFDVENSLLSFMRDALPTTQGRKRTKESLAFSKEAMYWFQIPYESSWTTSQDVISIYKWDHLQTEILIDSFKNPSGFIGDQKIFYDSELDEMAVVSLIGEKKGKSVDKIKIQYFNESHTSKNKEVEIAEYIIKSIRSQHKKHDLYDLKIKNITQTQDQGFFVGLQVEYILQKNYASSNMMGFSISNITQRQVREFYYGEYIGIQTHPVDSLNWQNIIRKSQLTQDDYGIFSSLALLNSGHQMVVFFNDLHLKRNQIQIGVLQANGEVIYGQIPRSKRRPLYYAVPELVEVVSPTILLIPVVYETDHMGLMRVQFSD